MARSLPMFPLGTVLMPHMVLPLHIFEPRYRTMFHDLMEGDREFGVVQIARGSETGGGDVRHDVGTIARVLQAEELDDGRWVAVTVGTRRLRVSSTGIPTTRTHRRASRSSPRTVVDTEVRARRDELLPRVRGCSRSAASSGTRRSRRRSTSPATMRSPAGSCSS
jgi:Lon protease-like protein